MDKRRKLTDAQVNEVKAMLTEGVKGDAVARTFGISTTHVYRIQAAMRNGEVKLKRSSLDSCLELIKTGLPFRRASWGDHFYYFHDAENSWFIKHRFMGEHGDDYEIIEYTLDLSLEDLMAKDWIVLTWESVE